jgi:predicted CXXCH cytochrome family protein
VTAFDSLIGVTGTAGNDMQTLYPSSTANLSNDLSNDHPIAVSVVTANEMNAIIDIENGGVPLFGGSNDQVECASCHDPHLTTYAYFLRLDPGAGTLCETCHTK